MHSAVDSEIPLRLHFKQLRVIQKNTNTVPDIVLFIHLRPDSLSALIRLLCTPDATHYIRTGPLSDHFLMMKLQNKEEIMTEQDWLALGVTLFVMSIIGLILWLGLTGMLS